MSDNLNLNLNTSQTPIGVCEVFRCDKLSPWRLQSKSRNDSQLADNSLQLRGK